ncbi:MAG: multinuclear nonheme iron-dependent oxidase, partial [Burkholderiaceae bacterium]
HVSANNLGFDAATVIDAVPAALVAEIHLAGHHPDPKFGAALLIDSHDAPVAAPVWALYQRLLERIGPRPTLIERDENVPAFDSLLEERERAHALLTDRVMEAA